MRERFRKVSLFLCFFAVLILTVCGSKSEAAKKVRLSSMEWTKVGDRQFMIDASQYDHQKLKEKTNGKVRIIAEPVWGDIAIGNRLYYVYATDIGWYIRVYDVKKDKTICCFRTPGMPTILTVQGGYVYYTVGNFEIETTRTYRYKMASGNSILSTKKSKRVKGLDYAGEAKIYKNYLVVMGTRGDPSPTSLRIYNAKTKKVKTIDSKCVAMRIIQGNLYYVTLSHNDTNWGSNSYQLTVKRCSLSGKNKKTLVKIKSAYFYPVPIITKTCVYYSRVDANRKTEVMKCDYKSGKKSHADEEIYNKLSQQISKEM